MKAAVYLVSGRSHEDHLKTMAAGLRRHGVEVSHFSDEPDPSADFAVTWGWRLGLRLRNAGWTKPILVMERGYLGDRMAWTSLGWDGLNGRAKFAEINDPRRFETHFAGLLKPWQVRRGYALIMGQVEGDAALIGVKIRGWYDFAADYLSEQGWDVRFRQHPVEVERRAPPTSVRSATEIKGSLHDALAGAQMAVTFNSNAGLDAVLAGVPVHAEDEGSIVWPLASQNFKPRRPNRTKHLRRLAWRQFTLSEIRDGSAWDIVKDAM